MYGQRTQTLSIFETSNILKNLVWFATNLKYLLASKIHTHMVIGSESPIFLGKDAEKASFHITYGRMSFLKL